MRTLFFLALMAVAGWYGWNHRDAVLAGDRNHEAVIENGTSSAIERVRLIVDGQTMVKDSIPLNGKTVIRFTVNNDSEFKLVWQCGDRPGDFTWRGGRIASGPLLQRHVFRIDKSGHVRYSVEAKGSAGNK